MTDDHLFAKTTNAFLRRKQEIQVNSQFSRMISILELDRYEHGVVINALNEMRNDLIGEKRSTDIVDEVLLKAIDAPTRKARGKLREER